MVLRHRSFRADKIGFSVHAEEWDAAAAWERLQQDIARQRERAKGFQYVTPKPGTTLAVGPAWSGSVPEGHPDHIPRQMEADDIQGYLNHEPDGHVNFIYTRPHARGNGVGTKLLDQAGIHDTAYAHNFTSDGKKFYDGLGSRTAQAPQEHTCDLMLAQEFPLKENREARRTAAYSVDYNGNDAPHGHLPAYQNSHGETVQRRRNAPPSIEGLDPSQIRYEPEADWGGTPYAVKAYHPNGTQMGSVSWKDGYGTSASIGTAKLKKEFRGKGLNNALIDHIREHYKPDLQHDSMLSAEGRYGALHDLGNTEDEHHEILDTEPFNYGDEEPYNPYGEDITPDWLKSHHRKMALYEKDNGITHGYYDHNTGDFLGGSDRDPDLYDQDGNLHQHGHDETGDYVGLGAGGYDQDGYTATGFDYDGYDRNGKDYFGRPRAQTPAPQYGGDFPNEKPGAGTAKPEKFDPQAALREMPSGWQYQPDDQMFSLKHPHGNATIAQTGSGQWEPSVRMTGRDRTHFGTPEWEPYDAAFWAHGRLDGYRGSDG